MNRSSTSFPSWLWRAGLVPVLAALSAGGPALPAAASAPVVTRLVVPVAGTAAPAACPMVALDGQLGVLVRVYPPDPIVPPDPFRVGITGLLAGEDASGAPYLALVDPLTTTPACLPPYPCEPIPFQLRLIPLGRQLPPDPCLGAPVPGVLSLTLNADGSVQAASAAVGSPVTNPAP